MNMSPAIRQNHFQLALSAFINGRAPSRASRALACIAPQPVFGRLSPGLVSGYRQLRQVLPAPSGAGQQVRAPLYDGSNASVLQIMDGLHPLRDHLAGAYVHGSMADGEYNGYSDFDGLVILASSAFESAATLHHVGNALRSLQQPMIELDPLQHHGWFVLTEADLGWHCEAVFPLELFRYSRSLLSDKGMELTLYCRDSREESVEAFRSLAAAVRRKAVLLPAPTDMFALKSLLSQIMLLPALYLQARNGRGVYKKHSFGLAQSDFAPALWWPMDQVSALRRDWHYELAPWRRAALTGWLAGRRITTRWCAPPIPPDLRQRLTRELWTATATLVEAMEGRLRAG